MSTRTCPNGHAFTKTSNCPTCPQCDADEAQKSSWSTVLAAPARRALENAGITTLQQLAQRTQQEVMALHGMGPSSLPKLLAALKTKGLSFKESERKVPKTSAGKGNAAISDYLAALPKDQREALQKLSTQIVRAVPGIEEHFSYGMPAFKFLGHPMLYIGAAKNHCALYGSVPIDFKDALKDYTVSKGAIQFMPDKPLPAALVKAIVKAKCEEIEVRWGSKDQKLKK
ncbi:MAG: DUF1801 domain-containing protein [Polyangiaceae bacterium]|nr:DUF1801 domain-containing protein [Polyangiaceae bacterium]